MLGGVDISPMSIGGGLTASTFSIAVPKSSMPVLKVSATVVSTRPASAAASALEARASPSACVPYAMANVKAAPRAMVPISSPAMAPALALAKAAPQGPPTALPAMVAMVFQPMVSFTRSSKLASRSPRPPPVSPLAALFCASTAEA